MSLVKLVKQMETKALSSIPRKTIRLLELELELELYSINFFAVFFHPNVIRVLRWRYEW